MGARFPGVVALARDGRVDKGVTTAVAPTVLVTVTGPMKAKEKVGGSKAVGWGGPPEAPTHVHLGCACRQNLQ